MDKMFNKCFVLCLLMQFWFMIAFNMTLPLIAQYVVDMGESATMAGFAAGIFSFLALAFRPISGYLTDTRSNKMLLLVGYIASIIAFVGYGLAPNVGIIIVFRAIHAFGLCLQSTITTVVAMAFIPKGREVEGVGYVGVAAQLGLALGPSLGVLCVDALGYQGTFFAAAVVMLLTIVLLVPIPVADPVPSANKRPKGLGSFLHMPSLALTVTVLTFSTCAGLTSALLVMLGTGRAIAGVTVFFLLSSLGIAAVRPFAGKLVDRRGLNALIPATFVSECACMGVLAFAGNLPLVLLASVFRIFGQGVAQSSLQGQVMKDAGPEQRGVASSTFFMGIDIGQGLGAIVGGALIDVAGFEGAFLFGPVALAVGLVSYLYWLRRERARVHARD